MPLPAAVLDRAIAALGQVVVLLEEWRAGERSDYRARWLEAGKAAIILRDEAPVRAALAECSIILDTMADSKDDVRTHGVIVRALAASLAIQSALADGAKGRP
jgi:hypothetical protein